jgi:prevent-host-death family protein
MREISIREWKRSLSATLDEVGRGEHVRVTNRGKPIADILPARPSPAQGELGQLITSGRIVPPSRPLPPQAPRRCGANLSTTEIILTERDAER